MAQLVGWWEPRVRSAARRRPTGFQVSVSRAPKTGWGTRGGSAASGPCQGQGCSFSAWCCQRLKVPRFAPAPRSLRQSSGRGRREAALHLLDQAPTLRGFAQEPPVVVGVGCGPVLLLLGVLRCPAPATETQSPGVSGATVRHRIPAHPELGGSSSPHLSPSARISERHIQNTLTVAEWICDSFLSRFSKVL